MKVLLRSRRVTRFEPFDVDLRAGELRKHGLKIKLQQQPFRVLALLLEHPGEVVTREELRQAIWPADTFVDFDEGLDATIYKLRNALGDSSENPRFVETLPRRGYRFIAPVEEVVLKTNRVRKLLTFVGALTAVALALFLGLNLAGLRDRLLRRSGERRIRSLLVLPLRNLSGDPSQDYFVDGMTEALITDFCAYPCIASPRLSDAYGLLSLFDFMPREVGVEQSKEAAQKALELDETLTEAHFSLGAARLWEWSWSVAEEEIQRAIALEPNNAMAHQWHGYLLRAQGRFDEAIAEMKHAQELHPLSPNKQQSLGATLYLAGHYDEALQQFHEVPDPDANFERRHRWMAAIYERKSMQREGVSELLTTLRLADKKDLAVSVERKYLSSGYAEAKKVFLSGDLREKQGRAKNASSPPLALEIAVDYALLGEKGSAYEWLDKAFAEHDGFLMHLKEDDRFEVLRPDPRFQDLLHRIGLSP